MSKRTFPVCDRNRGIHYSTDPFLFLFLFFLPHLSAEGLHCTLYLDTLLRGKPCFCVQEKKEQNVQCLVPFCKTPSPSSLFLNAFFSSQVNQAFQAWVLWIDQTPFNLFLSQLLWTESFSLLWHLLWVGFSSLSSKNNGIRMTNSCLWNAYSCFLCCSVRKKVKF